MNDHHKIRIIKMYELQSIYEICTRHTHTHKLAIGFHVVRLQWGNGDVERRSFGFWLICRYQIYYSIASSDNAQSLFVINAILCDSPLSHLSLSQLVSPTHFSWHITLNPEKSQGARIWNLTTKVIIIRRKCSTSATRYIELRV